MGDLGEVFRYPAVAAAYRLRPPYPEEVFTILERLIVDEPRTVLDLGAGEGALARPLAQRVDRVDAVDRSAAMIAVGRQQPGGQRPNLRWINDAVESAALDGPYALVTAGASLHWMDWAPLMTRLRAVMTSGAMLAVVDHDVRGVPWRDGLVEIIRRHSRSPDFDPTYEAVRALAEAGHIDIAGTAETAPVPFQQPIESYVEQFYSRASLAREHMAPQEAADFGEAIAALVLPWVVDGVLTMSVAAKVTWGRPT